MMTNDTRERRPALAGLLGMLVLVVTMLWAQRPPAALGVEAAQAEFSAVRALAVLRGVLGDERPHRLGTAANAMVRERVVAAFAGIGLSAEVRSRFVCAEYGVCGTPHNLLLRLPGAAAESAVLLTSHYDSVGAGPGAGDAGSGVAALVEIARALQTATGTRREILLLVADGEEAGLLGAEAFVREPEFARVGAVVNLEARGTRGRANLFETQPGNAAIIRAVAPALPYPTLSSLAYEIYTRMPNNTDFSVYKREGRAGVNFAFIEGGERYHTPLDDLAHLDPGSLQQIGANALAATRALAVSGVAVQDTRNRVYFDFGGVAWHWPEAANRWLLLAALGLAMFGCVRARRAGLLTWPRVAGATVLLLLTLLLAAGASLAMATAWRAAGATPMPWTANGSWLQLATSALGVVLAWSAGLWFVRRHGAGAWFAAVLVVLLLAAGAFVSVAPGASPLALLPLLVATSGYALAPTRSLAGALLLAAVIWLANANGLLALYPSLGPGALPGLALLIALVAAPLAVAVDALGSRARGRLLAAGWIGTLALAIAAALAAPYSPDTRAPLALREVSGPGLRRLQLLGVSEGEAADWQQALPALPASERVPPWAASDATVVALPGSGAPPPRVRIEALDATHDQILIESDDPEAVLGLALPAALPLAALRINGEAFAAPIRRTRANVGDWRTVHVYPGQGPVRVLVEWPAGLRRAGYALALHTGLSPDLAGLAQARDRVAVTAHFGDARIGYVPLAFPAVSVPES